MCQKNKEKIIYVYLFFFLKNSKNFILKYCYNKAENMMIVKILRNAMEKFIMEKVYNE